MNLETLKTKLAKVDAIPKGWRTTPQWAEYWKISRSQGQKMVYEALRQKLCVEKKFRIRDRRCTVRSLPHYKFKEAA